jgi:hypothetical protein
VHCPPTRFGMARMRIALVDRSNYYRGLLVLTGRDRIIDPRERELMLRIGKMLDFEKRLCEATIDDLLVNPHLMKEPVVFSSPLVAECFFRDAVRLAMVDGEINPQELRWLRRVAQDNGRTDKWLHSMIQGFQEQKNSRGPAAVLEIQQYL